MVCTCPRRVTALELLLEETGDGGRLEIADRGGRSQWATLSYVNSAML